MEFKTKAIWNKALSALLVMALLLTPLSSMTSIVSMVSPTVLAAEGLSASLADRITELYGNDSELLELMLRMNEYGLVDENGLLVSGLPLSVGGIEMTLDEARTLIDQGADLTQEVVVGSDIITLGDLHMMLLLEDELAFMRDRMLDNDVALTEEHLLSLMSLQNQLENEGLALLTTSSEPEDLPELVISNPLEEYGNIIDYTQSSSGPGIHGISVQLPQGRSFDEGASVKWRLLPGSAAIAGDDLYDSDALASSYAGLAWMQNTLMWFMTELFAHYAIDESNKLGYYEIAEILADIQNESVSEEVYDYVYEEDFAEILNLLRDYLSGGDQIYNVVSRDAANEFKHDRGYPNDMNTGTVLLDNDYPVQFIDLTILSTLGHSKPGHRWSGERYGYFQLYDPVNVLLPGGTETYTIRYKFLNGFNWINDKYPSIEVALGGKTGENHAYILYENPIGVELNIFHSHMSLLDIPAVGESGSEVYNFHYSGTLILEAKGEDVVPDKKVEMHPPLFYLNDQEIIPWDYTINGVDVNHDELYEFEYTNEKQPFSTPIKYNITMDVALPRGTFPLSDDTSLALKFGEYVQGSVDQELLIDMADTGTSVGNLYLLDAIGPELMEVTAPEGSYVPGSIVPVTVTFTEPVTSASSIYAVINGEPIAASESPATVSSKRTFEYTVKPLDNTTLYVTQIYTFDGTGSNDIDIVDLFGNVNESISNTGQIEITTSELPDVRLISGRTRDAVVDVTLKNVSAGDSKGKVVLELDQDQGFRQVFASDYNSASDTVSKSLYAVLSVLGDTERMEIPLSYTVTEDTPQEIWELAGEFDLPEPDVDDVIYKVELYYRQDPQTQEEQAVRLLQWGRTFTRAARINVTVADFSITLPTTWPSGEEYLVYTTGEPVKLSYIYTGEGMPQFIWKSTNPAVAEIGNGSAETADAAGTILPKSSGETTFVLYWAVDETVYCETETFYVRNGGPPEIVIYKEANTIAIRKGQDASVRWGTNLIGYNAQVNPNANGATAFTIEVFEGNFTASELPGLEEQPDKCVLKDNFTTNLQDPITSFVVAASYLTKISEGTTPSYTVRVSSPNPFDGTEILSAVAYIHLTSQPARVKLQELAQYSILDNVSSLIIDWSIEDIDVGNGAEAEFVVMRGENEFQTIRLTAMQGISDSAYSGSYVLNIQTVPEGKLKELYTVSLKAKNAADGTWSYDSFVLHVYHQGALELLVDGANTAQTTMSNHEKASSIDYQQLTAADIADLRQNMNLQSMVGINSGAYPWSQFYDGIAWKSSDSEKASLNYRQGMLYENIERFDYATYLPETQFVLSGLQDGEVTVTATHATTGMIDSLKVNVNTLRDTLYIFQANPAITTAVYYTNGEGQKRAVESNAYGSLAVYEPQGIASDITLYSIDSEEVIHTATLYRSALLSGERDSTALQLYPSNNIRLHPVSKADVFLYDETGKPYTGVVTVHGGAFADAVYCGEGLRMFVNTKETGDLVTGINGTTVDLENDGRLTVMIPREDFGNINFSSKVQLVLELKFANDDYRPELLYFNGALNYQEKVALGETTKTLTKVSVDEKEKPFLAHQVADYHLPNGRTESLLRYSGYVGPGSNYPRLDVYSRMLLWGSPVDNLPDYRLAYVDRFGVTPGANTQKSTVFAYPFSTIPIAENILTLDNIKGGSQTLWWDTVNDHKSRALEMRLFRTEAGKEALLESLPMPWRVIDMAFVEKVNESNHMSSLLKTLGGASVIANRLSEGDTSKTMNGFASGMVNVLSNVMAGPSVFKMLISPTKDPTVFTVFIWSGLDIFKGGSDFEERETGIYIEGDFLEVEGGIVPSVEDVVNMSQGSYFTEAAKSYSQAKTSGSSSSVDPQFHLTGFYEGQIQYNFDDAKWEIHVLGGGFEAGVGFEASKSINTQAGPIPLTFTVKGGLYITLSFESAVRYSELTGYPWDAAVTAKTVNDYLTTLRGNGYIYIFGGVGWDYSVVALKAGVFGKIEIDSVNRFLSRTYLANSSQRQINGQYLDLYGTLGLSIQAKLLLFEIDVILASVSAGRAWNFNNWQTISQYWEANKTSGRPQSNNPLGALSSGDLQVIFSQPKLESRSYLEQYERSWNSWMDVKPLSLDPSDASSLSALQQNAYPYTSPFLSNDGDLLVYVSDGDSRDLAVGSIRWSTKNASSKFIEGEPIDTVGEASYGVSSLNFAGSGDHAAAVWVRQSSAVNKAPGEVLSIDEQTLLLNSGEIMAAVYDGASWKTYSLTDNSVADVAPVVATNENGKVLVAWRAVSASDVAYPLRFDNDSIVYRIIDAGSDSLSEVETLYNGNAGTVYGLSAAMLPDGTGAVAYTLDKAGTTATEDESNVEIIYAVIDKDTGEVTSNIQYTHDTNLDENPQLTYARFGVSDYRFVLGWYSMEHKGDLKLVAFDSQGIPVSGFIEALSAATATSDAEISRNFRFARMHSDHDEIGNLSILWAEQRFTLPDSEGNSLDYDALRAVRFVAYENDYVLSAIMDVAEMNEFSGKSTTIDHFDAYIDSTDSNTVKAAILGSEYTFDVDHLRVIDIRSGEELSAPLTAEEAVYNLYLPSSKSVLYTATESYKNSISVAAVGVDYTSVMPNTFLPLQFTVENRGIEPITEITIELDNGSGGGTESLSEEGFVLLPNQSRTLSINHHIGEAVQNVEYRVTAEFNSSGTKTCDGIVNLKVVDIGIAQVRVLREQDGEREVEVTLYNNSYVPLKGSGYTVRLGVYEDLELSELMPNVAEQETASDPRPIVITDDEALALIDQGAYLQRFTFNIGEYMTVSDDAQGGQTEQFEIADSGLWLFLNSWIEAEQSGTTLRVPEYYIGNNTASVGFESLLKKEGTPVTIGSTLSNAGSTSEATVRLQNNSLKEKTQGFLTATLLDENEAVLEVLRSGTDESDPIVLGGEGVYEGRIAFSKTGAMVDLKYGDALQGATNNANLSSLTFKGVPVDLSDFLQSESAIYKGDFHGDLLVTAITEDPAATVIVNSKATDKGVASVVIAADSVTTIHIQVTAADGQTKRSYTLTIDNRALPASDAQTPQITLQPQDIRVYAGETVALAVTANVSDGGSLSYQWYSHSVQENSGGVAISGANAASYAPSTATTGTQYYYVEVTNVNNNVGGAKTAVVVSEVATVTVLSRGSGIWLPPNPGSSGSTSEAPVATTPGESGGQPGQPVQPSEPIFDPDEEISNTVPGTINGMPMTFTRNSDGIVSVRLAVEDLTQFVQSGEPLLIEIYGVREIQVEISIASIIDLILDEGDEGVTYVQIKTDTGSIILTRSMLQAYAQRYGDALNLWLQCGSLSVRLLHDGEPINWQVPEAPLLLALPVEFAPGTRIDSYVGTQRTETNNNILPLSVHREGVILFASSSTGTFEVMYNPKTFSDTTDHWAVGDVSFVSARELFGGMGNDQFSPETSMTRAMFATVLARLDSADLSGYATSTFDDVASDAWFCPSVTWASARGVVSGMGAGRFDPDAPVTREQMAAIFINYLTYKGYHLITTAIPSSTFADMDAVSDWARGAVETMQGLGIIGGRPGNLFDPQGLATRAEVAAMYTRLIEKLGDAFMMPRGE